MYDVLCFGEAMIRFTPFHFERLEQATTLRMTAGGSELNVAVGLARLGLKSAWVSKMAKNPLGSFIMNQAQAHGVDCSHVVWTNEHRVGLYFLEQGANPRASQVIYDRKGAAIASMTPNEVDWEKILAEAKVFHVSGITPALSKECQATTELAIATAKRLGCKVSFDINYRARLWSKEAARECLSRLLPQVNILISTSDDLEILFGYEGEEAEVARRVKEAFGSDVVVITIRAAPTVLHGHWSSLALADRLYTGRVTELELVDRVGSGDAYTAGFLYGYLTGDMQKAVDYGDAMSVLKHSFPGDFAYVTLAEVEQMAKTVVTRIQR
ncbi:MAG: sugar kinase [Chloroflexi bacterium]|nr:sugar kinase [Chloroflexota bacterium]